MTENEEGIKTCVCGGRLTASAAYKEQRKEGDRAITLCVGCGRFLKFDDNHESVPIKDAELYTLLDADAVESLLAVRTKIKETLCTRPDADSVQRLRKWNEREQETYGQGLAANLHKPLQSVRHSELVRFGEDSPYKSECPLSGCPGILLVRRQVVTFRLSRLDVCTHCLQHFWYTDNRVNHEEFVEPAAPVPTVAAS